MLPWLETVPMSSSLTIVLDLTLDMQECCRNAGRAYLQFSTGDHHRQCGTRCARDRCSDLRLWPPKGVLNLRGSVGKQPSVLFFHDPDAWHTSELGVQ